MTIHRTVAGFYTNESFRLQRYIPLLDLRELMKRDL